MRYSQTVQPLAKPWATGTSALYHVVQLALRDLSDGPRRGCTVPWRAVLYRGVPLGWYAVRYGLVWAVSNEPLSPRVLAALQAPIGSARST